MEEAEALVPVAWRMSREPIEEGEEAEEQEEVPWMVYVGSTQTPNLNTPLRERRKARRA